MRILRWMRILWRRVRHRFISWLLRVRGFPWRRLAGILRGVRLLRICSRVRRAGVRCARLHHGSLCAACLRDPSLHDGTGGPCKHGPSGAGVCPRSHDGLHGPGLRQYRTPGRTDGLSRCLHSGANRGALDSSARPGSGSDLLLDGTAKHDPLLRDGSAGHDLSAFRDLLLRHTVGRVAGKAHHRLSVKRGCRIAERGVLCGKPTYYEGNQPGYSAQGVMRSLV